VQSLGGITIHTLHNSVLRKGRSGCFAAKEQPSIVINPVNWLEEVLK
jgi:hypothetical protein